ncbi:alpha/beta fold hydrolase [Mesobacillus subterraneus]|uniref:alpha/beta hydrolase n=1 Tax=Mesobacillus subterraneus TaxID=285983 RepID=UPI00203D99AC|nr:alpha/beta fold hydrolase [Mesobacillus subterraneus]MCM3666779.1 alpha/beta fold hydrolase [Mesobacillus subterraneus]MCM3685675.1 alpha/beta fold hydrolase [Mesobacillus subterraneus]
MIGCLLIHGFTGAPFEVEPLARSLKERTDWKIAVPTLPGHGEELSLRGITYDQWIGHAENELKALLKECDTVYVVGFSMGGLIASYLASIYPVEKLVLLSAAAYYVNPKQLAIDVREMMRDTVKGKLKENELFRRYKRKIKETPMTATLQFRRLVNKIKPVLNDVKVPTLIAQGESDGIVPPKSAQYLYENIGSAQKRLIFYKNSKHLICHCDEKEQLFEEVYVFLTSMQREGIGS